MPVRCQECNHHFLLDGTTVAQGISCPECNGTKLERDQPSPTHSDGDLRNMVDPATQLDQGGNPLQEGIWANTDGGWQPRYKRDESFAKVMAGPVHQASTPDLRDTSTQQAPVMSNYYTRALSQDPYLPWYHEAAEDPQASRDRLNRQSGHRLAWKPGQVGQGLMVGSTLHTWPVTSGFTHMSYVNDLGVNPISVDFKRTAFGINADGTTVGNCPPEAQMIDPNIKVAIAPLVLMGGRMLLGAALGGLMRKAVGGAGNFLNTAPQPDEGYGARPVGLVASEKTAVGVDAPVETPDSTPRIVEDHDPESVDQQEFNDEDHSPAGNNPLLNGEAGGSQNPAGGEDQTVQKLEFRHDGGGVQHAEMLLPLIMEYINSDKSALENPQLKALHDELESEIPGYLELADENDEAVHKFLKSLKGGPEHESSVHEAAGVYMNTPINPAQMQMGNQQMAMPGTHQNPISPGGMPVSGKCMNCQGTLNADGSCPQCGAAPGANQLGNMGQQDQHLQTPGIMPSPYARQAADHQGPITPQQKEAFAQYLIQQGRNDEVAAMIANPAMYADEWAQFINKSTQPPEVDPSEQPPPPAMDPSQMGQMPVPGMSVPPGGGMSPTGKTADATQMGDTDNPRRCPKCTSATTNFVNDDGGMRCHRCGHQWTPEVEKVNPVVKSNWIIKSYQDALSDSPNPVAAPAAELTAPGDREQQADSSLTWQDSNQQPLQVGQVYEMHTSYSPIPDVVKVQSVKPDGITVTMEGEYNAPSDPQDQNGPEYSHEITLNELQQQNITFNPMGGDEGDQEQSQDQTQQDGIGQTVNTEPTRQSPEVPYHASVTEELPTDKCPKCDYGHVTSSYESPELVRYECFRCAHAWKVAEDNAGVTGDEAARAWLNEDDDSDFNFDRVAEFAKHTGGQGRNIRDIAKKDPRHEEIRERLNKNAGAKFSPREQREFIDEDGVARNADRLNLDGTHYVESAFDNSKANPDRVNDNYLGLGL